MRSARTVTIACFIIWILWGCDSLHDTRTAIIRIPALPGHLVSRYHPDEYVLSWLARGGVVEELVVRDTEITLVIPRTRLVPICARPVVQAPVPERLVCGVVITEATPTGFPVSLTWNDGFLAGFIATYLASSGNAEWFNFDRLKQRIEEATEGNPWNIDRDALVSAFESYLLSRSVVRRGEVHEPDLILPPGNWRIADPLDSGPVFRADARISFPSGRHVLFDAEGNGTVELDIGRFSWTAVVRASGTGPVVVESGSL